MAFPLQQGGNSGNSGDTSNGRKSSSMNPSSIDAMFQGLLPAAAAASPSNPRQLSGVNMNFGTISSASNGGMIPSSRLSQASVMSHQQNSLNSNLGEEIKRLQQLHQLTSATSASQASAATGGANHLMQGLLSGRTGASAMSMSNLGVKSSSVAAHQASMLQSLTHPSNPTVNASLGSLSQRDAATYLLMSQQQQQHQQQQQVAALQQQQQQALQQQLAGGNLLTPSAAAQLMAASVSQQQMLPSPSMLSARATGAGIGARPPTGAIEPFPEKLHRMLMEVEASGRSHTISFVDEGRAFAIHKPHQFFKEIVPLYFRQSRLSSFKRQLNLYGFELISNGPSRGAYYHELFQRDKPNLCRRMRRVAVKVATKKGNGADEEDANNKEKKTNRD